MAERTATEAIERHDKERERHLFELQCEAFISAWAPDDPMERSQFDAHLFSLVRQIYADAQKPVLDQLVKIAMAAPIAPIFAPKEKL